MHNTGNAIGMKRRCMYFQPKKFCNMYDIVIFVLRVHLHSMPDAVLLRGYFGYHPLTPFTKLLVSAVVFDFLMMLSEPPVGLNEH
jgi:hypothetical protein